MKTIHTLLIMTFAMLFISACSKKPNFPEAPVLTFESWNKAEVVQGTLEDQVTLTISFTDGDGDLISDNNEPSVFFMDMRDSSTFKTFALPQIPEIGVNNGISGEIEMTILETSGFCCLYPNGAPACQPADGFPINELIYEIFMEDRAGHRSNIIRTAPLIIRCE